MTDPDFRFEVAISFAGDNKRDKIRRVAENLASVLGREKVFFDEWYEDELAGLDANTVLANIYSRSSRLVVTCVCKRYSSKPWTQDEWRAIQALERTVRDGATANSERLRILPLRFEEGEVDGLYSTALVPDVRDRSPTEIAERIFGRLDKILGRTVPRTSPLCAQGQMLVKQVFQPHPPLSRGKLHPLHFRVFNVKEQNQFRSARELILSEANEPQSPIHDLQIWSTLGRYELVVKYRCPKTVDIQRSTIERLKLLGVTCDHILRVAKEYSSEAGFMSTEGVAPRLDLPQIRDNFGATVFILVDYRKLSDAHSEGWFTEQVLNLLRSDPVHFSVVTVASDPAHRLMLELVVPCGRLRSLNRLSASLESLFSSTEIQRTVNKETLIGYEAYDLVAGTCTRYDF